MNRILIFTAILVALAAFFTHPAAAAGPSAADQPRYEEVVIYGNVVVSDQQGKKKGPSYDLISDKKEKYKLIGPKTMLDLIPTYPDFDKLKFKVAGNMYRSKSNSKKGIMIKSIEPYYENAPKAPQAFQQPEVPAAGAPPATSEVKAAPATSETSAGGKTR